MEAHINKLYENLAKSYNKELGKLLQAHEIVKEQLAAEGFRDPELSIKAYHAVKSKLSLSEQEVGKLMTVVFLGKDPSKDTTLDLRKEILQDFWSDPETRNKIKEEGKIMLGQVAKGNPEIDFHKMYKPIVKLIKSVEVDGICVPTEFEVWDPSTNIDPLCRDYRTHLDEDEESINWKHSQPLLPNWKTTLFGIGFFEDTPNLIKKIQIRFFGDDGDPSSGTFVCKHISFMREYKMKVGINVKLTTEDCYVCNAKTKPVLSEEGTELNIVELIDSINKAFNEQLRAKNKDEKDLIPIISLNELKEWHLERRAQKDEDGDVIKSKKGWDLTNWDEYCLIDQIQYLGKREFTEDYVPATLQHDSTGKLNFYANYDEDLDMDIPIPSDLLICVKTGRGTTKYDREANEKIQDSDDPDISITICGYKLLTSYEKIIFPKDILGDL